MAWYDFFTKPRHGFTVFVDELLKTPGQPPSSFHGLYTEGYKRCVPVYSCINEILHASVSVPWVLTDVNEEELPNKTRETHRYLGMFARPNEVQDRIAFLKSILGFTIIAGEAFIKISQSTDGKPFFLWPLAPGSVQINKDTTVIGGIKSYTYTDINGVPTEYPPEEIIHIKNLDFEDIYGHGLSTLSIGRYTVDSDNESTNWNRKMIKNSMQPSGAFGTEEELGDKDFKRVNEEIKQRKTGSEFAGEPLLLDAGLKWQQTSINQRDADWLKGKTDVNWVEIAMMFQVPPELIGIQGQKTYANYKEARQAFYTETVTAYLDLIKSGFNIKLAEKFNAYLNYDLSKVPVFREAEDSLHTRLQGSVKEGIITRNEARKDLGKEPETGGDELTVSGPVVPLKLIIAGGGTEEE